MTEFWRIQDSVIKTCSIKPFNFMDISFGLSLHYSRVQNSAQSAINPLRFLRYAPRK